MSKKLTNFAAKCVGVKQQNTNKAQVSDLSDKLSFATTKNVDLRQLLDSSFEKFSRDQTHKEEIDQVRQ